jgi:hypothetical protein
VRWSAARRAAEPTALWSCKASPVRMAPTMGGVPPDIRSWSSSTYMCAKGVTKLTVGCRGGKGGGCCNQGAGWERP